MTPFEKEMRFRAIIRRVSLVLTVAPLALVGLCAALSAAGAPIPGFTRAQVPLSKVNSSTVGIRASSSAQSGYMSAVQASDLAWALSQVGSSTPLPDPLVIGNLVVSSSLTLDGGDAAHTGVIHAYTAPTPPALPGTQNTTYTAAAGVYSDTSCSTPIRDGDPVACWADQSGNGRNLIQATAGSRPIYTVQADGHPSIVCDGVDDVLAESSSSPTIGTAYFVAKYASAAFASYAGGFTDGTGNDTRIMFTGSQGGTIWYSAGTRWGPGNGASYVDGSASYDLAPLTSTHVSIGVATVPSAAVGGLQICQDRNNASRFWSGPVFAAGIYSTALSGSEVATLNTALAELWQGANSGVAGLRYHIPSGVGAHTFDGAVVLGSSLSIAGTVGAAGQITSTVTTGSAPFVVSSVTKCTNLNADLLDGVDSTAFYQSGASPSFNVLTANTVQATVQLGLTDHPRGVCGAGRAGDINYDSGHFYGCNGSTWLQLDN